MWMSRATEVLVVIATEGSLKGGTTEGIETANETGTARTTVANMTFVSITAVIGTATATASGWTGSGWTGSSKGTAWTAKGLRGLDGRVQEVLLSTTVIHPRELATACKSEVWLEDGKTVVAEVPRVDPLRAREGEAVLGVTGGYWTGLVHRFVNRNRRLKDAKFVFVSRAVRIAQLTIPSDRLRLITPTGPSIVRATRLRIIA